MELNELWNKSEDEINYLLKEQYIPISDHFDISKIMKYILISQYYASEYLFNEIGMSIVKYPYFTEIMFLIYLDDTF
jgi:hypothetical protein